MKEQLIMGKSETEQLGMNPAKQKKHDLKLIKQIEKRKRHDDDKPYEPIKFCIVIDDAESKYLRNNDALFDIIRQNRHFKLMNILSCHSIKMIEPRVLSNINQVIMFKNMRIDKLKDFFNTIELPAVTNFDMFYRMYLDATHKPYSFITIDMDVGKLSRCFEYTYSDADLNNFEHQSRTKKNNKKEIPEEELHSTESDWYRAK